MNELILELGVGERVGWSYSGECSFEKLRGRGCFGGFKLLYLKVFYIGVER